MLAVYGLLLALLLWPVVVIGAIFDAVVAVYEAVWLDLVVPIARTLADLACKLIARIVGAPDGTY